MRGLFSEENRDEGRSENRGSGLRFSDGLACNGSDRRTRRSSISLVCVFIGQHGYASVQLRHPRTMQSIRRAGRILSAEPALQRIRRKAASAAHLMHMNSIAPAPGSERFHVRSRAALRSQGFRKDGLGYNSLPPGSRSRIRSRRLPIFGCLIATSTAYSPHSHSSFDRPWSRTNAFPQHSPRFGRRRYIQPCLALWRTVDRPLAHSQKLSR